MHRLKKVCRTVPLIAVMLLLAGAVPAQENQGDPIAVILRINGSLDWREAAGGDWKPARVKQALYNGNQVRTEIGNRAIIVYTSGTRILVNENTELEIAAQVPPQSGAKPTTERTKLIVGEVYSKIRETSRTGTGYEVETPSSVASVRGTEFNSSYGDGVAEYLVIMNQILVANSLGSQNAGQFQMVTSLTGQMPGAPQQLSEGQANNMVGWLENVEPVWKLNLVPQGGETQEIGADFTLNVWAMNMETGSLDNNATFPLTGFGASSDVVEFSTDRGRTWTASPDVSIVNGAASLLVRGTEEGSATITAEAPLTEPASLGVNFTEPKDRKVIELIFTDPDGTEQTLILEMEEK